MTTLEKVRVWIKQAVALFEAGYSREQVAKILGLNAEGMVFRRIEHAVALQKMRKEST